MTNPFAPPQETMKPINECRISISPNAAHHISYLIEQERKDKQERKADLMLRLRIKGGGCSGFQYEFSFDDKPTTHDRLFAKEDITVVVDEKSLPLLDGSELDYVEDLIGASFQVKNPKAQASCGCGTSFSV